MTLQILRKIFVEFRVINVLSHHLVPLDDITYNQFEYAYTMPKNIKKKTQGLVIFRLNLEALFVCIWQIANSKSVSW